MISPDINANTGVGSMSDSALSQLQKLQDKVRALEKQNATLRRNHRSEEKLEQENGVEGYKSRLEPAHSGLDDIELIDIDGLDGEESTWLLDQNPENPDENEVSVLEWLRPDVETVKDIGCRKKSLVHRLDELTKRSPVHSLYSPNTSGSSRGSVLGSPYKILSSTPARQPDRGFESRQPDRGFESRSAFDPRTFSRGSRGISSLTYPTEDARGGYYTTEGGQLSDGGQPRKSSRDNGYLRLAYGTSQLNTTVELGKPETPVLNHTFDTVDAARGLEQGLNSTFNTNLNSNPELNLTFERTSDRVKYNSTFSRNNPNSTFETANRTFEASNRTFEASNRTFEAPNRTFEAPNRTFEAKNIEVSNKTFEKDDLAERNQRKMSEDRLSSASSGNRLSRGSSQEGLLEDLDGLSTELDRLSTTSGLSDSLSVSHRLNDVQDVQDVARMQEESLRHPPSFQNRSATISPSSEASLCSPQGEEGGGYQSEGSCGSEGGVGGRVEPQRGEERGNPQFRQYNNKQYSNQQYSSQDSLPDSPYSSQSLDSHTSQGPDTRRSMPNLNKMRGRGGAGQGALVRPQYGLSQTRYNSDSKLQPPSRLQGPLGSARVSATNLRAPVAVPTSRPTEEPVFVKPEPVRKTSGIARPSGLARPSASRLPAPRGGIPRGGATFRRAGSVDPSSRNGVNGRLANNQNWEKDCY